MVMNFSKTSLRPVLVSGALALMLGIAMHGANAQPAPAPSSDWLAEVVHRMDNAAVIRGDFEQAKSIKGFKRQLVSHGTFLVAKGQGIQWVTQAPFASTLVVTQERLTTVTDGGVQQMDTRQEPGLRAVNELLLAVLGGDMQVLKTRFEVQGGLQGAQGWRMTLVPKEANLARFISRIEMDGDRHVQNVRLFEGSGDESKIRFSHHSNGSLSRVESDRFK